MNQEARAYLQVMSGPEDGETVEVRHTNALVGPVSDALLSLAYDPTVPQEGVRIDIGGDRAQIGDDLQVSSGELFRVGQVWMRIVLPTKEGA